MKRERQLHFGLSAGGLCAWTLLFGWAGYVAGYAALLVDRALGLRALIAFASADVALSTLLAIFVLRRARRVAVGTPGRLRLSLLAIVCAPRAWAAGTVVALSSAALAAQRTAPLLDPALLGVPDSPLEDARLALLSTGQLTPCLVAAGSAALGFVLQTPLAASSWFLLSPRQRRRVWLAVDALLLTAFVAVVVVPFVWPAAFAQTLAQLSWQMELDDPALSGTQLAMTTVVSLRLLARLLPPTLDLIESFGFRLRVAARMLRARKSGFLTVIGALSIGAVMVSSCTLTATLSVMGGFRNDLKRKILGNDAHLVVDRREAPFEGWLATLETVRAQPGVVAATPYVRGEVMITSATNLAGAVLRGIDPTTAGDVTDLPQNLRHGQLDYLVHPERLLSLRVEEMRRSLIDPDGVRPAPRPTPRREPAFEGALREKGPRRGGPGGGYIEQAEAAIRAAEREDVAIQDGLGDEHASGQGSQGAEDALRVEDASGVEDAVAPFLRGDLLPAPLRDPATDPASAEVLPGLIVGQELARSLRLHLGDEVQVVSPLGELGPSGPMPKTRPFRVAGIFYSGMYDYDMKVAYTTLEAAQSFLNIGDGVSGIEAKVRQVEEAEEAAERVRSALAQGGLRVRAWQEINQNLFGALALEKLAMFIALGIAILVASFCIVGTLVLMVQEKGREVGILKAMGATRQQIIGVFMAQGLMIGLLGASVGLGLGYVACFAAEHYGIRLNPEVYYIDQLPVHIDPVEFALVWICSVFVCLVATIYPALLGSRLSPVEALRYS